MSKDKALTAPVDAVVMRAVGFCFNTGRKSQWGDGDRIARLGFVFSDGSARIVGGHYSSSEAFAEMDIRSKPELSSCGVELEWIGDVEESDERIQCFRSA